MAKHTDGPPDDCASCRSLFEALTSHHAAGGGKISTAALGTPLDLGERAARIHLAHLAAYAWIGTDRRTPLITATDLTASGEISSPLDWALSVTGLDKTCRRCLILLATHADAAWGGQMGREEMAEALSISVRCLRTHLGAGHLGGSDDRAALVRWETTGKRLPSGRATRGTNRYLLLSGLIAEPVDITWGNDVQGGTWQRDRAAHVLDHAAWWPAKHPHSNRAISHLVSLFDLGWPEAELIRRVNIEPYEPPKNLYALLASLLPGRREPYIVPAVEAVTGIPAGPVYCAQCTVKFPHASGARPGQVCRACREEAAEGGADPGPPPLDLIPLGVGAGTYDTKF